MNDEAQQLEAWLRDQRWSRDDPVPETGHLEAEALEALAEGARRVRAPEREHLAACSECRYALSDLISALPPREAKQPWWQSILRPAPIAGAAVALAAVMLLAVWPVPPAPSDDYQIRGKPEKVRAQVSLLSVRPGEGAARPLAAGAEVALDGKLGFVFGDLDGAHTTLTVLGWDGQKVHWYYPEAKGQPPHPVKKGARSERLPFDIDLSKNHRAGSLLVVGAFDVDPAKLAARLEAGEVPDGPNVSAIRLTVVTP